MSDTKTYTFTEEQLRLAFKEAAKRRDEEIVRDNPGCDNAWLMRISTWYEFAEDAVKRLIDSVQPQDDNKTAEQEEEEPTKIAGYISSRPVEKLQFNIDTLKLNNLPGCYKMVKEEGGFFKALSNMWNAGDWFEDEVSMEGDDTPCSFLEDGHCCSDTFWVNPKYAHTKASDLGEIGCREVAMDGTTAISIMVYYKKDDGIVIAYDLNAC